MGNWHIIPFLFFFICLVSICFVFSFVFGKWSFEICFGVVCVFCIINWYFEYVYRILCIFLYIWTYLNIFSTFFEKVSQRREQFSYEGCFWTFWDFGGPKWSPPISGVNVKVPFWGNILYFFCFFLLFCFFKFL